MAVLSSRGQVMEKIESLLKRLSKNKHVKYGFPMLTFIVGGSFGLREYTSLKYEFRKTQVLDPKECEKLGIKMKEKGSVTLESEYDKIKDLDIDNWENIRGPRLWDDEVPQEAQ